MAWHRERPEWSVPVAPLQRSGVAEDPPRRLSSTASFSRRRPHHLDAVTQGDGKSGLPPRGMRAWDRLRTPATIARLVWLVGIVSLVSAASPAFHDRARLVAETVPPVFPAAATTGTLAAGVVLMLLANGLRRGKFRAWLLATILTAFATVAHLVKGLDVEEAALTAAVSLPARHLAPTFPRPPRSTISAPYRRPDRSRRPARDAARLRLDQRRSRRTRPRHHRFVQTGPGVPRTRGDQRAGLVRQHRGGRAHLRGTRGPGCRPRPARRPRGPATCRRSPPSRRGGARRRTPPAASVWCGRLVVMVRTARRPGCDLLPESQGRGQLPHRRRRLAGGG